MRLSTLPLIAALLVAASLPAVAQKKVLTHDVYDSWKSLVGTRLSDNGAWIAFTISPQEGDNTFEIKATNGSKSYKFERGQNIQFSADSQYAIATITPTAKELKEATEKKVPTEDRPKNSLLILNLATGQETRLEKITSFSLAPKGGDWILYRPEPPKKEEPKPAAKPETDSQQPPAAPQKPEDKKVAGHGNGATIVLRNLKSGKEIKLDNIGLSQFNETGTRLYYTSTPEGLTGHGLFALDLGNEKSTPVMEGLAQYRRIAVSEDDKQVAILCDIDDYRGKEPSHSIFVAGTDGKNLHKVATAGDAGMPEGWMINKSSTLRWSKAGDRIEFSTVPKPKTDEKPAPADTSDKAELDVWSWTDKALQPEQLLRVNAEKNRTYSAIYDLKDKRVYQIETLAHPDVTMPRNLNGDYGLVNEDKFSGAGAVPAYVGRLNIKTGQLFQIADDSYLSASFSPTGRWIMLFDLQSKLSMVMDPATGDSRAYSDRVPFPIFDINDDHPTGGGPYGVAGYTKDDSIAFVYDEFDIWAVNLTNGDQAKCVTGGYGRNWRRVVRFDAVDPELEYIDPSVMRYFSVFDTTSKQDGIARGTFDAFKSPRVLFMEDALFGNLQRARNAEVFFFQRETVKDYRDVYVSSDADLANAKRFSDANPQTADYVWPTVQLVNWTSLDGQRLQGKLYRPDNFDPTKEYPMITYFYELESDSLNQYQTPGPSASVINIAWFVSNGYFVFVPDVTYKTGYPGEGAMSCIVSGVNHVVEMGNVDRKKLGIQGQSWGGYQVAYLVTETNMFAAAGAGAAVSNMVSAYGGIRYGSGLVRQMQYEGGQSRIGGTPWEYPLRYIENSPIFFADKVQTPLLMMNNDKDGSVPYTQGIEFFTALWRLKKPVWMLVYNNEDHNLIQRKNRKDLSVRLGQFFGYYLKGEPMPVWMKEGIPATKKGTYGFEPAGSGSGAPAPEPTVVP